MLKSYIKLAYRNLKKRKFYTAVMLIGLSVGFSFSLVIGSFIYSEYQVNKDIKNVQNHYLLTSKWAKPNMGIELTTLAPLASTLKENYPHLIQNAYSYDGVTAIVQNGDNVFREGLQIGSSEVLSIYGFPLLHGDINTALQSPNELVLSQKTAIKYFGKTDVIDESLTIESFTGEQRDFIVKGVLSEVPFNSVTHLFADDVSILMAEESLEFFNRYNSFRSWINPYIVNFIELSPGIAPHQLEKPINQTLATNTGAIIQENLKVELKPLSSLHLSANDNFVRSNLLTLSLIIVFILIMAMVNFVNITIGNSVERLREMGVRKVLGGSKAHIFFQFLTESTILALFSFGFSLLIYRLTQSYFSDILGKPLTSLSNIPPQFFLFTSILAIVIGLFSGLIPALSISSLSTVASLKGQLNTIKQNVKLRRGLIATQFGISLFVIASALIISQQMDYMFSKDLGFDKSHVVHVNTPRDWSSQGVQKMITVRNEMSKLPNVISASLAYEIPDGIAGLHTGAYLNGQDSTTAVYASLLQTDENYIETYGMHLMEGRFFNPNHNPSSISDVVINETTSKALGFNHPSEAINKLINIQSLGSASRIAGVIRDFQFGSMHESIGPMILSDIRSSLNYRYLSFKISDHNIKETLSSLQSTWKSILPNAPFEYDFLDLTLQNLYTSETRLKKAAHLAAFLSIVIVVIGILGLVSISVVRRTKEIGIRKVLGATFNDINWLFIKEYLVIAIISIAIAIPFIFYFNEGWLNKFAYRIDINYASLALLSAFFCLVIIITIRLHIAQNAKIDPVKSLKTE